jgi:hypothetical protein
MCINRSDSSPRALDQHLASLERDGVTIVEDVYSPGQLAELRAALARACGEVDEALPSVAWSTMHYQVRILLGAKLAREFHGPTLAFYSWIPAGMRRPACIFWTNLTRCSPAARVCRPALILHGEGAVRGQALVVAQGHRDNRARARPARI